MFSCVSCAAGLHQLVRVDAACCSNPSSSRPVPCIDVLCRAPLTARPG